MSDIKTDKRPQDSSEISLEEPYEVEYWCKKFHCTKQQLKDAVSVVGHSAKAVGEYLKNN